MVIKNEDIFIISSNATEETSERIARRIHSGYYNYYYRMPKVIVRYGSTSKLAGRNKPILEINERDAIKNTINKAEMFRTFSENGVPHPRERYEPPFIMRSSIHAKGNGFLLIESLEEMRAFEKYFRKLRKKEIEFTFMEYISIEDEYRVYVCDNHVFWIDKKVWKEGADPLCRNFDRGWKFESEPFESEKFVGLKRTSIDAVRILGLDFGFVDVCYTKDNKVCVFEVNSGAGLMGIKADIFSYLLLKCIERKLKEMGEPSEIKQIKTFGKWLKNMKFFDRESAMEASFEDFQE